MGQSTAHGCLHELADIPTVIAIRPDRDAQNVTCEKKPCYKITRAAVGRPAASAGPDPPSSATPCSATHAPRPPPRRSLRRLATAPLPRAAPRTLQRRLPAGSAPWGRPAGPPAGVVPRTCPRSLRAGVVPRGRGRGGKAAARAAATGGGGTPPPGRDAAVSAVLPSLAFCFRLAGQPAGGSLFLVLRRAPSIG